MTDEQPEIQTNEPAVIGPETAENGASTSTEPEHDIDTTGQSPVMQPPLDQQDNIKPANETTDVHGQPAPAAKTDAPGLSPAFHNPDLITDFADTAPDRSPTGQEDPSASDDDSDDEKPKAANAPGQPIADAQPTDQAQRRYDTTNQNLATCPICQHKFTPGTPIL